MRLLAAPPVPGAQGGRQSLATPPPLPVLVSLCRLKLGRAGCINGDGAHRCRNLHRHIHRCVAPLVSHFYRVQVTPVAHCDFANHFCEVHQFSRVVFVVACSLAVASHQSRLPPSLCPNPLTWVGSCVCAFLRTCPPSSSGPAVLGGLFWVNSTLKIDCRCPFFNCYRC
jgi:hypothetical protein